MAVGLLSGGRQSRRASDPMMATVSAGASWKTESRSAERGREGGRREGGREEGREGERMMAVLACH